MPAIGFSAPSKLVYGQAAATRLRQPAFYIGGIDVLTVSELKKIALQIGYDACYVLPAEAVHDAPENIRSILILIQSYQGERLPAKEEAAIHPYYFASQKAYQQAKTFVESLSALGEGSIHLPNLALKEACKRVDGFVQRKNSLLYHSRWGSRFHLQVIGLYNKPVCDQSLDEQRSVLRPCGACQRCQEACPVQAISHSGVDPQKCLRQHMLTGKGTPLEYRALMGNRLIGCDVCQAVCPFNEEVNKPSLHSALPIEELLPPTKELLNLLAKEIGANLTNSNRLCAQACLVAANSKDISLLPRLQPLVHHASTVISIQAQWAIQQLTGNDAAAVPDTVAKGPKCVHQKTKD